MRPHPRIRKTIKWGGAATTVLLVVIWIGSGFVSVMARPADRQRIYISRGRIGYADYTNTGASVKDRGVSNPLQATDPIGIDWRVELNSGAGSPAGVRSYLVPLWPFIFMTVIFTAVAWRRNSVAHRAEVSTCLNCGYSRTGLTAATPCPECGKPAIETTSIA